MANSYTKLPNPAEMTCKKVISVMDTFATPAEDVDAGSTEIKKIRAHVAAGSDYLMVYDALTAIPGTDVPAMQIATSSEKTLTFLHGGSLLTGLSFTVSDVGGTAASTNPTGANTITMVTVPS